jgi:predicted RNA-binding protein with RPS1 domain
MGNASYILLLGPMLEEKYGSGALVKAIVITAVITALVDYIFFPNVALCGASGVVFAFILLTSFTGFRSGEIPLTFILITVIFIGQQVYEGVFIKDNISQISHKRVKSVEDVLKVGQEVKVKVIAIKDGKLSLSMKALEEGADEGRERSGRPEHSSRRDSEPEYKLPKAENISTNLGSLLKGIKIDG